MVKPILRKLNKKARPDGYFKFKYLNYRAGQKHYKESQICCIEGKYTTPLIQERIHSLVEYNDKIYGKVDEALSIIYQKIASECKELELLVPKSVTDYGNKENQNRMMAITNSNNAAIEKRRIEILIHLSKMRMNIQTVDIALQHHLEKAEQVILKHISEYWSGVLKAASGNDLPPYPNIVIPNIKGKEAYVKHLGVINDCLNEALSNYVEE